MTRIKRRYISRKCRIKIRLFASNFRGAHSRLTRKIPMVYIIINRIYYILYRKKRVLIHKK